MNCPWLGSRVTIGVKQGHINSSDHYKVYIGPCLETLEEAQTNKHWVSGCADEVFLGSDDPVKFQSLIDIAAHYGLLYRINMEHPRPKLLCLVQRLTLITIVTQNPGQWMASQSKL